MKKINYLFVLLTFVFVCSCSSDDEGNSVVYNDVRLLTDANFGSVLADQQGKALYFFSLDHKGDTSLCQGGCLDVWPIFYSESLSLDSGLLASDFGEITHPNGQKQTTYKGWPLYYYAEDNNPGDITGDGRADVWFVAKPNYDVMYVSAQLIGRDSNGNETNLVVNNNVYEEGDGSTFYIVDDRGQTLYTWKNDALNTNNFTIDNDPMSPRNMAWPVAQISAAQVPSILNASDFGTIQIQGWTQLTYKGWPIYYYGGDMGVRGNNFGVGSPSAGVWPIANLDLPQPQ